MLKFESENVAYESIWHNALLCTVAPVSPVSFNQNSAFHSTVMICSNFYVKMLSCMLANSTSFLLEVVSFVVKWGMLPLAIWWARMSMHLRWIHNFERATLQFMSLCMSVMS